MYLRGEKTSYRPLEYLVNIDFQGISMGIKKYSFQNPSWTKREIRVLRRWHDIETYKQISKRIGKSPKAIEAMSFKLWLPVKKRPWTEEEKKFLKENKDKMTITEIAKKLKRSKSGVHYRISKFV